MARDRSRPHPAAVPGNRKAEIAALAQAGRLEEAKALGTRLCAKARKDPEAWFLLGAIHGHLGEYGPAADCCRKSVALQNDVPMTHYNLGIALHRLHHYPEAAGSFRRALALQPGWAEAHHDLGNALQAMGDTAAAIESYRAAVGLRPAFFEAQLNLGNALQAAGELQGAAIAYQTALQAEPQCIDAGLKLANLHLQQGELASAAEAYGQVLAVVPDHYEALIRLADVQRRQGELQAAADGCRAALTLRPDAFDAHHGLALVLLEQGELEAAETALRRALEIDPNRTSAWSNLGLVLHQMEQTVEAEHCYLRALDIDPDHPEAHQNLAHLLRDASRFPEAQALLDHTIELDPRTPVPHWDRALLWLLQGDFERGWAEYEWRWEGQGVPRRSFGLPQWDGSDLAGRGLLVYAEQGVGDEVMFASCLPDLLKRGAQVVLDCDPRLAPLFSRSFPGLTVHGGPQNSNRAWLGDTPPVAAEIAIGSLPLHLRRRLEDFPRYRGYLAAADPAVRKWRQRYAALGAGMKIGISWRGGRAMQKARRSTALDQWQNLFALPGAHWIDLQYGDCGDELRDAEARLGARIRHWEDSDPLRDLDDFAAQIAALDLIVSIDNSTVHLAGALGVEVWTLQPYGPNWRWLATGNNCHWYGSLRHFRQPRPGDWEAVFREVRTALAERI